MNLSKASKTVSQGSPKKKPLSKLLENLGTEQRKAVRAIIQKLDASEPLNKKDVGLLGQDWKGLTHKAACEFFHISAPALYKWVDAGAPRNKDNTYDLHDLHRWRVERLRKQLDKGQELKKKESRKLDQDIEFRGLRIKKMKGEVIEADKHQMILGSRAAAMKQFLEATGKKNVYHFANKTLEEVKALWNDFAKGLMNAWLDGSKSIDV